MSSGDHFLMGAGVFIQRDDGRILVVHHAKTRRWVIPGGKAEPGETPRQCAVREAREETGLDGRPGRLLAVQHLTADRWWGSKYIAHPYELFVFALHVDPGQHADIRVPAGELLGWDWLTADEG
ncbi:NUDIX hydrolase [Streptomyces cinnamoneus]|uniref:NUDIX hydrolase n=1 Tax=Streptomyces cinnamoneus TaxID=53446 RepID=UPI0033C2A709